MIKKVSIIIGLLILFAGCASRETPVTATPSITEAKPELQKAKIASEEEWEKVLNRARKERKVVIYSTAGGETPQAIRKGLKESLGLEADMVSGRGAEMVQKVLTEKRAGLNVVDVYLGGFPSIAKSLKPAGILEYLPPILILPEVKDGKNWYKGELHWVDGSKNILASWAYPSGELIFNTNLVMENELSSARDLLNPKWKGKIIMDDASVEGPGVPWVMTTVKNLGVDFLKKLAEQEVIMTRNERQLIEWAARGKYAIVISSSTEIVTEFIRAGAPIRTKIIPESAFLAGGSGSISLIKDAPHPESAKAFINWFLSREGQLVACRAQGVQSARVDIPTDFLAPAKVRKPNIDYFIVAKEELIPLRIETMKLVKDIFGEPLK